MISAGFPRSARASPARIVVQERTKGDPMYRTEEGLLVFAKHPCRTGCSHADEAYSEDDLERIRGRSRRRSPLSRADEQEIVRIFRPGSARGRRPTNVHAVADRFRVSSRTIHRVAARALGRALCPGLEGRGCATGTPGGRLCYFCRRTGALLGD